jgi:plasmid maintenance system killer protein
MAVSNGNIVFATQVILAFFYEQQLTRYQRQIYRKAQGRLTTLQDRYEEKTLRTSEFLLEVGNLFAPSVSRTAASSDSD